MARVPPARSTVPVNHYYFYLVDRDFGPLFIKFCSYFPYPVKVCLNGHEWLKRQLTHRGIAYQPLDNGIRATEAAARVQRLANTLDAAISPPTSWLIARSTALVSDDAEPSLEWVRRS